MKTKIIYTVILFLFLPILAICVAYIINPGFIDTLDRDTSTALGLGMIADIAVIGGLARAEFLSS